MLPIKRINRFLHQQRSQIRLYNILQNMPKYIYENLHQDTEKQNQKK